MPDPEDMIRPDRGMVPRLPIRNIDKLAAIAKRQELILRVYVCMH